MTDMRFKNIVLVTGASSGIGLATAQKYLKEGYTVWGIDKDDSLDCSFPIIRCEVSDIESIRNAFCELAKHCESIKYLINCAGIFYRETRNEIQDMQLDEWNAVLQTNLTGMMLVIKEALPYLKQAEGDRAIVNISSDQTHFPRRKNAAYSVSKGGVNILSKACAVEMLEYGIRVNTVATASVRTNFISKLAEDFETMNKIYERESARMPLGIIESEDVAETIYYFGSERSRKITGQEILINSGLYL